MPHLGGVSGQAPAHLDRQDQQRHAARAGRGVGLTGTPAAGGSRADREFQADRETQADREFQAARVAVVSRVGCHLCDQALAVVRQTLGIEQVTVLDVDGDLGEHAARAAEWSELVPVVLIDGSVHDVIRVNPDRLIAALADPPRPRGRLGRLRRS